MKINIDKTIQHKWESLLNREYILSTMHLVQKIPENIQNKILNYVYNSQEFKTKLAKQKRIKPDKIIRVEHFLLDFDCIVSGKFYYDKKAHYRDIQTAFFHTKFDTITGEFQNLEIDK